jgi:hypothetical protein
MSPVIRQQCQAAREVLERYRRAESRFYWALGLFVPGAIVLGLIGFPALAAASLPLLVFLCSSLFFLHSANRINEIPPFYCDCYQGLVAQEELREYLISECGCDPETEQEHIEKWSRVDAENYIWDAWVCGFCPKTNPEFNGWPGQRTLIEQCKKCGQLQHSVLCWRCDKPLIWDESGYQSNPKNSAWYSGYPPPAEAPPPVTEERPPKPIDEDLW